MAKMLLLAVAVVLAATLGADAQDHQLPTNDLPQNGGAGLRTGNITSTGATVPNPGISQGGGTTPLDLGVQNRDNKIDSSICKGC